MLYFLLPLNQLIVLNRIFLNKPVGCIHLIVQTHLNDDRGEISPRELPSYSSESGQKNRTPIGTSTVWVSPI